MLAATWFTSMSNTKQLRHATAPELEILAQFARLEISLKQLRDRLGEMLEFDFEYRPGTEELGGQSGGAFEKLIDTEGRTVPGSTVQKLHNDAGQVVAQRRLTSHFLLPQPGVRVELWHIRNAMGKHERGEITARELSDWAAMLLLNDAYDWEGPDEDEIAEWLNDISFLTLKPEAQPGPNHERF
jgi:hypothetical protein